MSLHHRSLLLWRKDIIFLLAQHFKFRQRECLVHSFDRGTVQQPQDHVKMLRAAVLELNSDNVIHHTQRFEDMLKKGPELLVHVLTDNVTILGDSLRAEPEVTRGQDVLIRIAAIRNLVQ